MGRVLVGDPVASEAEVQLRIKVTVEVMLWDELLQTHGRMAGEDPRFGAHHGEPHPTD